MQEKVGVRSDEECRFPLCGTTAWDDRPCPHHPEYGISAKISKVLRREDMFKLPKTEPFGICALLFLKLRAAFYGQLACLQRPLKLAILGVELSDVRLVLSLPRLLDLGMVDAV